MKSNLPKPANPCKYHASHRMKKHCHLNKGLHVHTLDGINTPYIFSYPKLDIGLGKSK